MKEGETKFFQNLVDATNWQIQETQSTLSLTNTSKTKPSNIIIKLTENKWQRE
jgi:hypothetical protein